MTVTRISVLVLGAVSGLAVPALAVIENQVQIGTTGDASHIFRNATGSIIDEKKDGFSHLPLPHVDPAGIEIFLEASESATAGSAMAEAHVRAIAQAGRIGAGIILGAAGLDAPEPPGFPTLIDATGRVTLAFAVASFKDTWDVPPVPGVPIGTPIRIRGLLALNVEGDYGVAATGRLSQGRAIFTLKDIDGGATTLPDAPHAFLSSGCPSMNCWGYIERNISAFTSPPTNVDFTLEPPFGEAGGTIRVELFGNVGGQVTVGYEIGVSGQASSGDGAVAVSADFSHTLKWGGIESIINRNTGQVIEGLTIESESGFDYMRSFDAQVPEPSGVALLSCGLCVMLGQVMPQRRRI